MYLFSIEVREGISKLLMLDHLVLHVHEVLQ